MGYLQDDMIWMGVDMCALCANSNTPEKCNECNKSLTMYAPSNKLRNFMLQHRYAFDRLDLYAHNIIICFPGVGASYMSKHLDGSKIKCVDHQSATYVPGQRWPHNYVEAIMKSADTADIVFVDFSIDICEALAACDSKHNIMICYPKYELRDMWSDRLLNRGNSKEYARYINDNFDVWVSYIKQHKAFYPIVIESKFDYISKHLNEMSLSKEQKDIIRKLT